MADCGTSGTGRTASSRVSTFGATRPPEDGAKIVGQVAPDALELPTIDAPSKLVEITGKATGAAMPDPNALFSESGAVAAAVTDATAACSVRAAAEVMATCEPAGVAIGAIEPEIGGSTTDVPLWPSLEVMKFASE